MLAALIGFLGDFDLAEEAVQDAFVVALERWPSGGVPDNPAAWIVRVGRNRAIDRLRRERKLAEKRGLLERLEPAAAVDDTAETVIGEESLAELPDDRLRLIFTAAHPALAPAARVALTLRTLGGLTTGEIARAFLTTEPTMAQRLVRAKRKIRDAGIPYEVPGPNEIPKRLPSVLATLYLVFNEGYAAAESDEHIRRELCAEAIRLTRILREVMPGDPEVDGLLALMLLHDARRDARVDEHGEIVLLDRQDRRRWNHQQIGEGIDLTTGALGPSRSATANPPGPYALQAAIAAHHAVAWDPADTDWARIRHLYDWLALVQPTPVVARNRAVAVAMSESPERGLEEIDRIQGLDDYPHLHSARGDLLARLDRRDEAAAAFRRALQLVTNPVERSLMERRLRELGGADA